MKPTRKRAPYLQWNIAEVLSRCEAAAIEEEKALSNAAHIDCIKGMLEQSGYQRILCQNVLPRARKLGLSQDLNLSDSFREHDLKSVISIITSAKIKLKWREGGENLNPDQWKDRKTTCRLVTEEMCEDCHSPQMFAKNNKCSGYILCFIWIFNHENLGLLFNYIWHLIEEFMQNWFMTIKSVMPRQNFR